jgi:hypothetical protein
VGAFLPAEAKETAETEVKIPTFPFPVILLLG